jgi:hypothetical protein
MLITYIKEGTEETKYSRQNKTAAAALQLQ